MNWLKYVLEIVSVVPIFVKGIETIAGHAVASGQPKPTGAEKSQAVLALAGAALGTVEEIAPQTQKIITAIAPGLQDLINATVKLFNETGVFQTSSPMPVAAVAATPGV